MVGEEGREKFEARIAGAEPLSEYFVRSLAEQIDLSHADGRARFAEAARPLLAKLPPGVYHELLLGRVAEAIKLPAARLAELWNTGGVAQSTGSTRVRPGPHAAESANPAQSAHATSHALPSRRQPGRAHTSAGRGSLVRQAVDRLLRFPPIAAHVTTEERTGLDRVEEPGIELLRELLDNLRAQPAQSSGQVIQRWADRPEQESLVKLLQKDDVITDAATAAGELRGALLKLAELADTRRFEALNARISQSGMDALNESERIEFTRLVTRRPARS
jgi:DNA primase